MNMVDTLPPRAWTDISEPEFPEEVDQYKYYIEWLADYLFTTDIPLHPRQLEYVTQMGGMKPSSCIFEISDIYGYTVDVVEGIENSLEDGEDWTAYDNRHRDFWDNDFDDQAREDQGCYEEWATSSIIWHRCRDEWLEKQELIKKYGNIPDHADIPFRSILALSIKQIPGREDRIKYIQHFFQNFFDNASK